MTIVSFPKVVTVKNARLFFDHKRSAFRLIHYNEEILTVVVYEPKFGNMETDLVVENIYPVSDSSIRAIQEALNHIGIKESIEELCKNLNIDPKKETINFWGYNPRSKKYSIRQNTTQTALDMGISLKKRTEKDWYDISLKLETTELKTRFPEKVLI